MESPTCAIDESVDWLTSPDIGWFASLKNIHANPGLMQGAYFGCSGDPIIDLDGQLYHRVPGSILVHNPGVRKVSCRLRSVFARRTLVVIGSSGSSATPIGFPEAQSEGWVIEKRYLEAWKYLGKTTMTPLSRILIAQRFIPDTVYQITRSGVGQIGFL